MKFILFNVSETNKHVINSVKLDSDVYINEVCLSKEILASMENEPKGIISRVKKNCNNRAIEKKIVKALEHHDKKWYYILSNSIVANKYLANKAQELLGYKFTVTNELNTNIFKYIDEYVLNNNALKKHELKLLVVASSNKSINFKLIENLIKQYKTVNLFLNEKPSSFVLKRIKEINKAEGTTIDILKPERKSFVEYNVIYFVDDFKSNYPRFRMNKNGLILDVALNDDDKFNSNIIFINEFITRSDINKENVERLLKEYNKLQIASAIKITNELDKS